MGDMPVGDYALKLASGKTGFAELAHAHARSCVPLIILMKYAVGLWKANAVPWLPGAGARSS